MGSRICAILSLRKARTSLISASDTGSFGLSSDVTTRSAAGPLARIERALRLAAVAVVRSIPPRGRHDLARATFFRAGPGSEKCGASLFLLPCTHRCIAARIRVETAPDLGEGLLIPPPRLQCARLIVMALRGRKAPMCQDCRD